MFRIKGNYYTGTLIIIFACIMMIIALFDTLTNHLFLFKNPNYVMAISFCFIIFGQIIFAFEEHIMESDYNE